MNKLLFPLSIILLLVIGAGAFFIGSQRARQTPTPSPTPVVTPEATPEPSPVDSPTATPRTAKTPTPSPTPTPTPTPEPKADLYISKYEFDRAEIKQGEPFTIKINIVNQGNKDAGAFWWEWKATWAITACRQRLDSLAAGSSKEVSCTYTYGGWATYQTKAIADADNEVAEDNEDNNTHTQSLSVKPSS